MNIVISTDIFCDGENCGQWVNGVTGRRTDKPGAEKEARRQGWKVTRRAYYCPECRAMAEKPAP